MYKTSLFLQFELILGNASPTIAAKKPTDCERKYVNEGIEIWIRPALVQISKYRISLARSLDRILAREPTNRSPYGILERLRSVGKKAKTRPQLAVKIWRFQLIRIQEQFHALRRETSIQMPQVYSWNIQCMAKVWRNKNASLLNFADSTPVTMI